MRAERDDEFEHYRPAQKTGPTVWEIAKGVWLGISLAVITWTILGWMIFGGIISAMNRLYLR